MEILKNSTYHPDLFGSRSYQICTQTVMDTTDQDIVFDKNGVCNHVHAFDREARPILENPNKKKDLENYISQVKEKGKGKKYDCLIGLSGGVDSSYVAYLIKEYGLRPLAVHLDNGWNSELAVHNIHEIVSRLNIDLHTIVVDWKEFRSIQLAYLKASVVDIEVVTDHAITAAMYKLARKKNIQHIISGMNLSTEYIMPNSWLYRKMDFDNLNDINSKYGSMKFKTYPTYTFKDYIYYTGVLKLNSFSILDYVDFNKDEAKRIIQDKLNWRDYGGKHYESTFTKFYQAYILPNKFGIDKRKAHLSTMICSGQMSREEALKELEQPLYDEKSFRKEKDYVLKKFGLKEEEFEAIMKTPPRLHTDFKTDLPKRERYMRLLKRSQKARGFFKKKQKDSLG